MPYEKPDRPANTFQLQDVWHYRIEGHADGVVIGYGLLTKEIAKRWLAQTHGVDISDVVCHTPSTREET